MPNTSEFSIMLVDDIDVNIDILVDLLGDDYHVRVAMDGQTALEDIHREIPDLILLDIMMPGMDGYEVCRRLKSDERTRDIPIIFVTARGETEDELKGLEIGAVDYISKPVSPPIVKARVKNQLELKQTQQKLKDQNNILKENVRLREEVDRISRHDLKTPLNVIISLPQILMKDDQTPPGHMDHLRAIEKAGYTMLNMINRSLDLIKMEQGTYTFVPAPVDLLALVTKIVSDLHGPAAEKKCTFQVAIQGQPANPRDRLFVSGEELLCYSMLANLIKNAVEACPEQTVIHIGLDQTKTQGVQLKIHNQGMVPEQIQDTFFEKYATAGKAAGTGLGTYSALLMASTMGGSITMATHPVDGTTVTVTVPLFSNGMQTLILPPRDNAEKDVFSRKRFPGLRVLIVDDDPDNITILKLYLNHPCLIIASADNGRTALEKWRSNPVDIILMDMEMPVMGGMEAVRQIRLAESQKPNEGKPVTILALSAHDDDIRKTCIEVGFNDYLPKPVRAQELYEKIDVFFLKDLPPMAPDDTGKSDETGLQSNNAFPIVVDVDMDLEDIMPGFLHNKKLQIKQTIDMIEACDFNGIKQIGHKLKGGFNMYGMERLGAVCQDLELAAVDRDIDRVRRCADILVRGIEHLTINYI